MNRLGFNAKKAILMDKSAFFQRASCALFYSAL